MYIPSATLRRIGWIALISLTLGSVCSAQQDTKRDYQFEDETIEVLDLYRKENDLPNKDYTKLLALLDGRLEKLKDKSSYDAAMLLQFKAKALIEKNEFAKAIVPMEQGLILSDKQNPTYLDSRATTEVNYFLAQLYYQEANTSTDFKIKLTQFEKAEIYISRWADIAAKITEDGLIFHASLLYSRATLDDNKIDKARITKALNLVDKYMHLATHPKDNLYLLKLACLQQLDRPEESAEIFEILLKNKPQEGNYWKQLAGAYLSQKQPEGGQPVGAIRAIVTLERAQALGLLNTPADNNNIVALYFNAGQFEKTAELLEKGLKDGSLENKQESWELLAICNQQLNRDYKAIDALKRAAILFPKSGQLDYMRAQTLYGMQKLEDTLSALQDSIRKGAGTKPHQTYLFLAYIAYELKKFDIALEAATKAAALPEGAKEGTRMKQAVEESIRDRDEKAKKA